MVEVLRKLKDIVKPAHTALIIVDAQNDFCSIQGLMAKQKLNVARVQPAVDRLNYFVKECRKVGVLVVWIKEVFGKGKVLPNLISHYGDEKTVGENRCVKEGGKGAELYSKIIPPEKGEPIVIKWLYDGFEDTDLHLTLQSAGINTLLVAGFITNCCVETTARHGFIKGYYILLVSDCTDTYTQEEYDATLHNIRTYFGKVATSDEIATLWK